jgi:hypothetical protein
MPRTVEPPAPAASDRHPSAACPEVRICDDDVRTAGSPPPKRRGPLYWALYLPLATGCAALILEGLARLLHLVPPHEEADVPQGAELVHLWSRSAPEQPAGKRRDQIAQRVMNLPATELLPDPVQRDGRLTAH